MEDFALYASPKNVRCAGDDLAAKKRPIAARAPLKRAQVRFGEAIVLWGISARDCGICSGEGIASSFEGAPLAKREEASQIAREDICRVLVPQRWIHGDFAPSLKGYTAAEKSRII
jgi:hypothetical protein